MAESTPRDQARSARPTSARSPRSPTRSRPAPGLPEILRAAARALDASLILIDRSASVLAVAARSPADERSLMRDAEDVDDDRAEGRRGDGRPAADAQPRGRPRRVAAAPGDDADRLRGRARPRARARLRGGRHELPARGARAPDPRPRRPDRARQGARYRSGGWRRRSSSSAPIPRSPTEDDWRRRLLAVAGRGARSIAPGLDRRAARGRRR